MLGTDPQDVAEWKACGADSELPLWLLAPGAHTPLLRSVNSRLSLGLLCGALQVYLRSRISGPYDEEITQAACRNHASPLGLGPGLRGREVRDLKREKDQHKGVF